MKTKHKYNINWLIKRFENGEQLEYIFFWGHTNTNKEEAGKFCLSQWFESPFTVGAILYKTAEHWMMAQKALLFNDINIFGKIIQAHTPAEAKKLGRDIVGFDEQIWNENKYEIVTLGSIHKFNQYPLLAAYLLETENKILVEASPVDAIWGIGIAQDSADIDNIYAWPGENLLGFALMEARDFLKEFGLFSPLENTIPAPWLQFSGIDTHDMFWRMGKGEEYMFKFAAYYQALSDREKKIYQLIYPEPNDWKGFYD